LAETLDLKLKMIIFIKMKIKIMEVLPNLQELMEKIVWVVKFFEEKITYSKKNILIQKKKKKK
jgi:hypothetical protein